MNNDKWLALYWMFLGACNIGGAWVIDGAVGVIISAFGVFLFAMSIPCWMGKLK